MNAPSSRHKIADPLIVRWLEAENWNERSARFDKGWTADIATRLNPLMLHCPRDEVRSVDPLEYRSEINNAAATLSETLPPVGQLDFRVMPALRLD